MKEFCVVFGDSSPPSSAKIQQCVVEGCKSGILYCTMGLSKTRRNALPFGARRGRKGFPIVNVLNIPYNFQQFDLFFLEFFY